MASRRTRRSFSRKGGYIWTNVKLSSEAVSNTVNSLNIVDSSEFSITGSQKMVTLMAIRGWLSATKVVASGGTVLFGLVASVDEDISATAAELDPAISSTYTDEDILWTFGCELPDWSTASQAGGGIWHQEVNIKARRKLKTGQDIRIVYTNTLGSRVLLSGILRALLKVA